MPRYVRPDLDESVEAAIEAYGNRARVAIVGALLHHGPATRGELAQRIDVSEQTILRHLRTLLTLGLVTADPSPEEYISGQRVTYTVDETEVRRLYTALGGALGIT